MKRRAKKFLITIVAIYALLCVAGRLGYRALLYPAPKSAPGSAELAQPTDAQLIVARASDGATAHAWLFSSGDALNRTLIVHFHGNGETIAHNVFHARALERMGFDVALVEYRGYGISGGTDAPGPTEDGLYRDAEAILDALGRPRERTVLWGTSLGTGVATEMAKRGRGRALILFSPFTSITDIAHRLAPILPVSLLVSDAYDSRGKAAEIDVPVLIVHGTADQVVPYEMGVTLSRTFPHAKLVTIDGAHHNDLFQNRNVDLYSAIAEHAGARVP